MRIWSLHESVGGHVHLRLLVPAKFLRNCVKEQQVPRLTLPMKFSHRRRTNKSVASPRCLQKRARLSRRERLLQHHYPSFARYRKQVPRPREHCRLHERCPHLPVRHHPLLLRSPLGIVRGPRRLFHRLRQMLLRRYPHIYHRRWINISKSRTTPAWTSRLYLPRLFRPRV